MSLCFSVDTSIAPLSPHVPQNGMNGLNQQQSLQSFSNTGWKTPLLLLVVWRSSPVPCVCFGRDDLRSCRILTILDCSRTECPRGEAHARLPKQHRLGQSLANVPLGSGQSLANDWALSGQ